MGCYGIGPARIVAAAIEQNADEKGIVWPRALAPWQVHLVALGKAGEETFEAAERLYEELAAAGLEPLFDDRAAGPGEKLTDAELLGCPLRIVVGRRTLAEGEVEAQERRSGADHRARASPTRRRRARRDPRRARPELTAIAARSAGLFGIDRSGPLPRETRRGAPLHPWTIPNLVGYLRLAAIPVFCVLAFSSDDGRDPARGAAVPGDRRRRLPRRLPRPGDRPVLAHGGAARPGRRPADGARRGGRLLALRAPAALGAGACSPLRELATLVLAQLALRRGLDLEINWIGRIGVFLVFGGIFWSHGARLVDRAAPAFVVGVAIAVLATALYVRAALGRAARADVQPSSST